MFALWLGVTRHLQILPLAQLNAPQLLNVTFIAIQIVPAETISKFISEIAQIIAMQATLSAEKQV